MFFRQMKSALFLIFALTWGFWGDTVQATRPEHWIISTLNELLEGESEGVSITTDGRLVEAPALEEVLDTEEAFIYSAVEDMSGNLYLGTGSTGKIFRLGPRGDTEEWAQMDDLGIYALAMDSLNRLYAGTGPDGKVYRFDDTGHAQIFFDPKEKYIWSLAIDNHNNLFVGTGPRGIIYKVDPQGEGRVFYDSKETHIVILEWDINKDLLAGTAPGGLLLRVSDGGAPFVLFDSPLREIKAIETDRYGNIYLASLGLTGDPIQPSDPTSENSQVILSSAKKARGQNNEIATVKISGTGKGTRLQVHKINKKNLVETLYTSHDQIAFDMLMQNDGTLLIATGDKGQIISIDNTKFVTLLSDTPEEQVTQLVGRKGEIYVVTSNLGKVFRLHSRPSEVGVYRSKVLDARMPATWGVIRWHLTESQSKSVKLYTRSGNTGIPDETWNKWSGPYQDPAGSHIESSAARFLQWKVEFTTQKISTNLHNTRSSVDSVNVSYLQQNMSPKITSLSIHPPGTAFVPIPSANPGAGITPGGPNRGHARSLPKLIRELDRTTTGTVPRKVYIPGALSISWENSDPNQDDLTSSIYYRGQGEASWKILKRGIFENYYTMDGKSFPDGSYRIKVVISDLSSNPPHKALESELISKSFVIANSSPLVSFEPPQIDKRRVSLKFSVHTRGSTVHQAEYSVDSWNWNILFPSDGIADSPAETYSFSLKELGTGEHIIRVRAVDSVGNIATTKTTFFIN